MRGMINHKEAGKWHHIGWRRGYSDAEDVRGKLRSKSETCVRVAVKTWRGINSHRARSAGSHRRLRAWSASTDAIRCRSLPPPPGTSRRWSSLPTPNAISTARYTYHTYHLSNDVIFFLRNLPCSVYYMRLFMQKYLLIFYWIITIILERVQWYGRAMISRVITRAWHNAAEIERNGRENK